jgi:3-dehydroquinate synthase II
VKKFWLNIQRELPSKNLDELIQASSQYCDIVLTDDEELLAKLHKNKIKTCSKFESSEIALLDGLDEDLFADFKKSGRKIAVRIEIKDRKDEELVIKAVDLLADYILISCKDWKIIPLENIIAQVHGKCVLIAEVSSPEEADVALKTLELGADGIMLVTPSTEDLSKTYSIIKESSTELELTDAEIVDTKTISMGARVCIDSCDLMKEGEGMLVGSQSSALFLIESETHESPYVETRPFRVNAGPVSLYILSSDNKTKYLSELKAGDEVAIVARDGNVRLSNIGRVKIELRPLLLIEAKKDNKMIKTIVQNAETIRVVTDDGSKSVTDLKKGDKVKVRIEEGGRHFGTKVEEETVIER